MLGKGDEDLLEGRLTDGVIADDVAGELGLGRLHRDEEV